MKDTITQVGLVVLGIFLVAVLIFGGTTSFKGNMSTVGGKVGSSVSTVTGLDPTK